MMADMQKKSVKKWIILLLLPFLTLVLVAFAQVIVHFMLSQSTGDSGSGIEVASAHSTAVKVINVISFVIGTISVPLLILTPLWIVLLVRDLREQKRK
jgi:hypothetical protein